MIRSMPCGGAINGGKQHLELLVLGERVVEFLLFLGQGGFVLRERCVEFFLPLSQGCLVLGGRCLQFFPFCRAFGLLIIEFALYVLDGLGVPGHFPLQLPAFRELVIEQYGQHIVGQRPAAHATGEQHARIGQEGRKAAPGFGCPGVRFTGGRCIIAFPAGPVITRP